ncbi:HAD hydrolase family protein [Streptococcus cameli]
MKFVFDIDGTLCFDRMTIADEIKQVLAQAPSYGHEIAFASARSYRDCMDVLGSDLNQEMVIGLNGGIAYHKGELVFEKTIESSSYQALLDWFETYRIPFFVDNHFDYSGQKIEKMPFFSAVDSSKRARFLKLDELVSPVKIVAFMGEHIALVEETVTHFQADQYLTVSYHKDEECLYINPAQTNKATTVAEMLGEEVIAFGNDTNDIDLFEASLYAVQVGDFKGLRPYADEQVKVEGDVAASVAAKILQVFADFRGK